MQKKREILKNFVVIEGIDGAGSSTLIHSLGKALKALSLPITLGKEPSDGPIGSLIRQVLTEQISVDPRTLALLFAADRQEHLYGKKGIQNILNEGGLYLSDRYFFSSLAYQSLDSDWNWVDHLNSPYPLPAYLIFLGLPVATAQKRLDERQERELFDEAPLQNRVSRSYVRAIEAYRGSGMKILELDAQRSPQELCDASLDFLQALL